MEDFERELSDALVRRPAPPSLKQGLMKRRRRSTPRPSSFFFAWKGLAASMAAVSLCILAALAVYGGIARRQAEERRQGEAARQQVLTALRITGHALNQMNTQLAAHGRTHE
jgi:hypothetical protein